MLIIGLSGKAKHGKSTIAGELCEHYGFSEVAFATALKRAVREIWDLEYAQLNGEKKDTIDPRHNTTPRRILQDFGVLMRDKFGGDIWIEAAMRWINRLHEAHQIDRFVISDVRFKNEAEAIKELGGIMVRVHREDAITHCDNAGHISETDLDDWDGFDIHLNNDGPIKRTCEHLWAAVEDILPLKEKR